MKKRKLKNWVKVVLTIIVIIVSILIYIGAIKSGELAQSNSFSLFLCVVEWAYLFMIQPILYITIWEL